MTEIQHQRASALMAVLEPERRTRIADVGARLIGGSPHDFLLSTGTVELWGFEPAEDAFEELQARQSETQHYLPFAVGDGAKATLHMCEAGGFSSLLEPDSTSIEFLGRWKNLMKVVDRIPVQTRRLDDIEELPNLDMLKIDIQGAELMVFRNGREKLSDAVAVVTEVGFFPLYKDQPTMADQMTELADQGFVLHRFMHQVGRQILTSGSRELIAKRHRNQLIDGDAVFIRDPRKPENYSDEQLKHLAVVANGFFFSFDLALWAIDQLNRRNPIDPAAIAAYRALIPFRHEPAVTGE